MRNHRSRLSATQIATVETNRAILGAVFADLRRRGYLARQNFSCCAGCAGAELAEVAATRTAAGKTVRGCVFYTRQDAADINEDGGVLLAFGPLHTFVDGKPDQVIGIDTAEIGREVVDLLHGAGLAVTWDGSPDTRIDVDLTVPVDVNGDSSGAPVESSAFVATAADRSVIHLGKQRGTYGVTPTAAAIAHAATLKATARAYMADEITYEEMSRRNRETWDAITDPAVHAAVQDILRRDLPGGAPVDPDEPVVVVAATAPVTFAIPAPPAGTTRVFEVAGSNLAGCRTIIGPHGIQCPAVPENMALYFASLMDTAYAAGAAHGPGRDCTSPDCWFGGDCEKPAVYDIAHGHSAFGLEVHSVCQGHLAPMLESSMRRVGGWGHPLPVTITRRSEVDR